MTEANLEDKLYDLKEKLYETNKIIIYLFVELYKIGI